MRGLVIASLSLPVLASSQDAGAGSVELERLWQQVVPDDVEAWQTIPWRLELGAARAEAEASGRPLFLWTMNGHPLGCT